MLLKDTKRVDPPKEFLAQFKKPVMFELHVSQTPTSHITKKRSFPRSRGIEPFYLLIENKGKEDEKIVVFRYAETSRPKSRGGITEYEYTPNEIEFLSKGNIICDPTVLTHRELCYWMSQHPQNFSSPNFDEKKGAIFYEVNPEKEAQARIDIETKSHEAKELILKKWNTDQLREVALEFGDTAAMEKEPVMLKDFLMRIMTMNPVEFYDRVNSDRMKRRAEITEAIFYGIIAFDDKNKIWNWGAKEVQEGGPICKCMNNEDEKDRLLRHFDTSERGDNIDYYNDRMKEERVKKTEKSGKEIVT